ncbi:MAG: hypothetical protein GXP52_04855 [Deltaproteobacteria bacterium]|nr:hypothetical protein [Deltaproteobacteria bacterium]
MPRKHRLEFPGAIYHINHRGNHQEYIYRDNDDRKLFLKLLKTTILRMNWICHAYCLMDNHYHLLIEIPEGILSRGMATTSFPVSVPIAGTPSFFSRNSLTWT